MSRDFPRASEYAGRASEILNNCPPSEKTAMARAVISHNQAYALLVEGRYANSIAPLLRSVVALEACSARAHAAEAHVNLAFARFAVGDTEESEIHLQMAEEKIVGTVEWLRKYVFYLRGEIAQRRGRHVEARAEYGRLSKFYPTFANLADLLSGVSLFPLLLPERR